MKSLPLRCPVLALLLALLLGGFPAGLSAQQRPEVSGFQAFLFNSTTGTLSPDILTMNGVGNAPAGEYKSVSTFVVVRVSIGKDAPIPAAARLRLVATEGGAPRGRVLLDRTVRLGPVAADGTTFAGFWLADTGCRPITLHATLAGKGGSTKDTVLPFACYE